ncbi:protein ORFE11A [Equid gammaherpesvirus 5]|nr:protein ORFE11A [Equid gammaherpesvirus 5]
MYSAACLLALDPPLLKAPRFQMCTSLPPGGLVMQKHTTYTKEATNKPKVHLPACTHYSPGPRKGFAEQSCSLPALSTGSPKPSCLLNQERFSGRGAARVFLRRHVVCCLH